MIIVLDALKMTVRQEAHEYLKKELKLPDYYGKNLDALYDCLTEMPGFKIVVEHALEATGTYFDLVMSVIKDVDTVDITIAQAMTAGGVMQRENGLVTDVSCVKNGFGDIDTLAAEAMSMSVPGGNFERLVHCMERAAMGEELTIGFIGGSITQGARASDDTKNYAYRCFEWWKNSFPKATFHYVNGGIGGTCSYFGVARAEQDLLRYQPDVVVVDFSVNDVGDNGNIFQTVSETYEGLIRKILSWTSEPAVVALYNVFYDTGETVEPIHRQICEYYGIPGAGMKETVYKRLHAGEFEREYISPDGLHPNDVGHEMVAAELCKIFEGAKKLVMLDPETLNVEESDLQATGAQINGEQTESTLNLGVQNINVQISDKHEGSLIDGLHNTNEAYSEDDLEDMFTWELPEPLSANSFENAVLWNISNIQPKLAGFRADASEKMGHLDCFKNGWIGKKVGDKITFTFECESIAVQYRKTINKPSPIARLTVDGDTEQAIILDGNFDQDWGDCLFLQRVLRDELPQEHTVEIEIIEATEEDKAPFYLLSVITA